MSYLCSQLDDKTDSKDGIRQLIDKVDRLENEDQLDAIWNYIRW